MLILPRKRVVGPGASLEPLAPWVSFNRLGGSTGTLTREGGIVQAPAALGRAWQGNGSNAGAWYPMSVLKTSASSGGFDSLAVAGVLQSLGQSGDVVSLGVSTNFTGGVCRLGWTTGGALSFFASDAADVSGQNTISSRAYNDGKPHVAVGLLWTDGAGNRNLRLFVDGALAASGSNSGGFNATTYDRFAVNCVRRASTVAFAPLLSFVFDGFFAKNVTESQAQAASVRLWDGFFAPTQRRIWVPVAGGGGVSGTSATTNANDTSSASGSPIIVGTSATTNAADTSTASGTPIIVGTSATTNAADTSSASGTVGGGVVGTSATTNANDTASASGSPIVNGTSATTNAADTASAAGWAGVVSGTVAATNRNDTAAAEGFIGAEPPRRNTGAGKSKRRRYTVEVDGQEYEVASPAEAEEVLAKVREQAEQTAAVALERAKAAEKRPTRKVLADARKALTLPEIKVPDEMQARVQSTLDGIESLYQSTLQTIEIAALLRKRQQEEEDDEDILLLIA